MVETPAIKEIKVLSFELGGEAYGLAVHQVLGVNPMLPIVPIPQAPNFVEGVVRIRDQVIPVIDLRKRFGLAGKPSEKKPRLIVAKVRDIRVALLVDGVLRVTALAAGNIDPPSPVLDHASLLKGVAKLEQGILLLLDLDKILSAEEVQTLAEVPEKVKPKKKKGRHNAEAEDPRGG